MSKSSYLQSSFIGGEWAKEVQGRQESEAYKKALNTCVNYYPIEQESLMRRQGTEFIGHTKAGHLGMIVDFDLTDSPLQLEFTSDWIRFISGNTFLGNGDPLSVVSISSATPALVTTSTVHGLATGNTVFFTTFSTTVFGPLFFRQFVVTVTSTTTFTIVDALTGSAIVGTDIPAFSSGDYDVTHIAELASPYTSTSWALCTFLQDDTQLLIFHPTIPTRVITQVGTGFGFAIGLYAYNDGPYLDINATSTTLTPSATTGSVNITASAITGINPTLATPTGTGFQSTDVGRHVRLYLAPAAWDLTSEAYVIGSMVTYTDGNFYVALKNDNGPAENHGIAAIPTNIDHWALLGYIPTWVWAKITAVTSTTVVVATIETSVTSTNFTGFNILPTKIWRLGAFTTAVCPAIGEWHEGRLVLAGAIINRFDFSMADGSYTNFAPTYDDGTVADNNGVAFTVKSNEKNAVVWMHSDDLGVLFGTKSSEWKLRASTLDDPITPSSIQARRQSKYGSSTRAIHVGRFHMFVQRAMRKVMELVFSVGTYSDIKVTNLSLTASHLSVTGIKDIRYAQEPKPTVWGYRTDGLLVGMTYGRDDQNLNAGWHQHPLGSGYLVESISVGPSIDQFTDHLYLVTNDAVHTTRYVERLTEVFDDKKKDFETFFLDGAIQSPYWKVATLIDDGFVGLRAYGYWAMTGKTVAGTFGALDMGDAVVATGGVVDYPFNAAIGFTAQYITDTLALQPDTRINPVIGFAYTSQGQLLRPDHGSDAGARTGPSFGKKRRNHWYAVLLNRTQSIKFGTDFGSTLKPAKLATDGGTPIVQPTLFSGIHTDTIVDDYSFDGMLSFQQTRPVPGQILAIAGFIEAHDK